MIDDERVFHSNVLAFISDKRIRVGPHWYEVADIRGARVAEAERSLALLLAWIISVFIALITFPMRGRLIAPIVDLLTRWVPWRSAVDANSPLVILSAIAIFLGTTIAGIVFFVYWVRRRFELYVRLPDLEMLACTSDNRGLLDVIDNAIKHAVKWRDGGKAQAEAQAAQRRREQQLQAQAQEQVQPQQPHPMWTAYGAQPFYATQYQFAPPPPWDPRSLPMPQPWLTRAFILVAFIALSCFTLSIVAFFFPRVFFGSGVVVLWRLGKWLAIGAALLKLVWLYRAWSGIPPWCRATATGRVISPAEAVGFHFIPILNLGWMYVAHIGVCEATNAVLDAYRVSDEPRASPRLAFLALTLASLPGLNAITLPLLLGRHMMLCDAAQTRMHALLRASPPPQPLQPPWEAPGQRSLVRSAWLGPVLFLTLFILTPMLTLGLVTAALR